MRELFVFCEKGDGEVNEDVCGMCGSFAWVIDGATDVFHQKALFQKHEVSKYVNALNERILQYAHLYQPTELRELLNDAIQSLYADLNQRGKLTNIQEYKLPMFTIAIVSVFENTLRYAILGDCFISYLTEHNHRVEMITDTRITKFSKHNREKLKAYYTNSDSTIDMQEVYQNTRKNANAPNGYPIGSVRGSGLMDALTGTILLPDHARFLICSDGLLDYFQNNADGNLQFFELETIHAEIKKMKQFLSDDRRFRLAPRPKKKDDCTIMLMEA